MPTFPNFPFDPRSAGTRIDPRIDPRVLDRLVAKIPNWNFARGLDGWTRTGSAFDHQPTYGQNVLMGQRGNIPVSMPLRGEYWHRIPYPIGVRSTRWIGTYDARSVPDPRTPLGAVQGDRPVGSLTSQQFVIESNFITFLIGGGNDINNLRIELLLRQTDGSFATATGTPTTGLNTELMRRAWWDVRSWRGQTGQIRITDNASGHWGHINVADIRFQGRSPRDTRVPVGARTVAQVEEHQLIPGDRRSRAFIDWDAPVWGVADLHAHPASHLAFGARVTDAADVAEAGMFWGRPGLSFDAATPETVADDLAPCNGDNHAGFDADFIRTETRKQVITGINGTTGYPHGAKGWPTFDNWPSPWSVCHEQMHVTWLRRAWEGGLRLLIASVTDNQLLSLLWSRVGFHLFRERVPDPAAGFDIESARHQLQFIRSLAAANDQWMQVVRTPEEARRAIRANKLAVILSLEMDNLSVEEIIALKNEFDVRHVTPVHLADNAIGGVAVYEDLFNTLTAYLNEGEFFRVTGDPNLSFRLGRPNYIATLREGGDDLVGDLGAVGPRPIDDSEYWALGYECHPDAARRTTGCVPGDQGHRNRRSLDAAALQRLMREGMLIDLAHMSEAAQGAALDLSEQFEFPMMNSHTGLRPDNPTPEQRAAGPISERGMKTSHAERMAIQGGVLGLGTGPTVASDRLCAINPMQSAVVARLTGEQRRWSVSLQPDIQRDTEVDQLAVTIRTGADDLKGGTHANAFVMLRNGWHQNFALNAGAGWANNSVHTRFLDMPAGTRVRDIDLIALRATTGGDVFGDNWNIDALGVEARSTIALSGGSGSPLARLTGERTALQLAVRPVPAGDPLLTRLTVNIRTGGDDLKAGRNAVFELQLAAGAPIGPFGLNGGAEWSNHSINSVELNLPRPVRFSEIVGVTIRADTGGGWTDSDNWNIDDVQVFAVTRLRTLLQLSGSPLARFTGEQQVRVFFALADLPPQRRVERIALTIKTGNDDLRQLSHAQAQFAIRGRPPVVVPLNRGANWQKGSTHTVIIELPNGTRCGEISSLTVSYDASSGRVPETTDNWDIAGIAVEAYNEEDDPVASWVGGYLEALNTMIAHGSVALGTDMNGFAPQVSFARNPVSYGTLRRCVTGDRSFDFTTDGLAHYGMLPDFFQALSQDGRMVPDKLGSLFGSAEATIRMWETVDNAAARMRSGVSVTGAR